MHGLEGGGATIATGGTDHHVDCRARRERFDA